MRLIKELQALKSTPFTHATLKSLLKNYKNPNDKIKRMVKQGEIIRVKQSLYVLGDIYYDVNISKELLANLIYGPSYISLEYALSYYGLIPERVYEITSITIKMKKRYDTAFGRFTYIKSPACLYSKGITIKSNKDHTSYLMASVEKALCDKIIFTQKLGIASVDAMIEYLQYDLRVDMDELKGFDLDIINQCISCGYKVKLLHLLYKTIEKLQERQDVAADVK